MNKADDQFQLAADMHACISQMLNLLDMYGGNVNDRRGKKVVRFVFRIAIGGKTRSFTLRPQGNWATRSKHTNCYRTMSEQSTGDVLEVICLLVKNNYYARSKTFGFCSISLT